MTRSPSHEIASKAVDTAQDWCSYPKSSELVGCTVGIMSSVVFLTNRCFECIN